MTKPSIGEKNRSRLLEDLSRFAFGAAAESRVNASDKELFYEHLPIAEHRRVLDDETLLVLGGRGAGKSQLFNVLRRLTDPTSLLTHDKKGEGTTALYRTGYAQSDTQFPSADVFQQINNTLEVTQLRHLWLGLLCGVLLKEEKTQDVISANLESSTSNLLKTELAMPSRWLPVVEKELESISSALDRADEHLRELDQSIVITYDDLDVLAAKIVDIYPLVGALLAFWLRSSRRWRRLRCKIFLRTDIFESDALNFSDSSKLKPLSVTLSWSEQNLYRLVLKRLVNGKQGTNWLEFLESSVPASNLKPTNQWGLIPTTTETHHRAFMENLIGRWMGTDKRKGDTYRWFLNHLQDSLGDIAPRSFLQIFEFSAQGQLQVGLPSGKHLLIPEQINGALGEVSKGRIAELQEEYTWIRTLEKNLVGMTVPIERNKLKTEIMSASDWKAFPKHLAEQQKRGDYLIDYLVSLGILRVTADNRIHVPDIYLFGFGMKRKGGIRRPRIT